MRTSHECSEVLLGDWKMCPFPAVNTTQCGWKKHLHYDINKRSYTINLKGFKQHLSYATKTFPSELGVVYKK